MSSLSATKVKSSGRHLMMKNKDKEESTREQVIEKPKPVEKQSRKGEIIHRSENHIMMSGQYDEKQRALQDPPLADLICTQKDGTYKDTGKFKPYGQFVNANAIFMGLRQVIKNGNPLLLETEQCLVDIEQFPKDKIF